MADTKVGDDGARKILNFLKQNSENTLTEISKGTGVPLKSLHHLLRQLKHKGEISVNEGMKPQKWSLGKQRRAQESPTLSTLQVQGRILDFLSQQKEPKSAHVICSELGLRKKQEANQALYKLQKDQLVTSVKQGQKPLWLLSGKAADLVSTYPDMFKDTSRDNTAPGAYSPLNKDNKRSDQHSAEGTSFPTSQMPDFTPYTPYNQLGSYPDRHAGHGGARHPGSHGKRNHSDSPYKSSHGGRGRFRNPPRPEYRAAVSKYSQQTETRNVCSVESEDQQKVGMTTESSNPGQPSGDEFGSFGGSDSGEDSSYDFDDNEDKKLSNIKTRYQEMMGNLPTDMAYFDDEEMTEEEEYSASDNYPLPFFSATDSHRPPPCPTWTGPPPSPSELIKSDQGFRNYYYSAASGNGSTGGNVIVDTRVTVDTAGTTSTSTIAGTSVTMGISGTAGHNVTSGTSGTMGISGTAGHNVTSGTSGTMGISGTAGHNVTSGTSVTMDISGTAGHNVTSGTSGTMESSGTGRGSVFPGSISPDGARGRGRGILSFGQEIGGSISPDGARGRGRGILSFGQEIGGSISLSPSTVSGIHYVGDIESQSSRYSQPACSPNSPGMVKDIKDFDWQPLNLKSATARSSVSQDQDRSPLFEHLVSLPSSAQLQRYALEGLTVRPASAMRETTFPVEWQSGSLGYQSFKSPHQPLELIQQMERTGLTNQIAGFASVGLPRSHSQPLLGSGPSSMPGSMDSPSSTLQITSESFAALNKNPISALMEYAQSRRMQATIEVVNQRGPSHRPVFVMAAKVGNRQFAGVTCHNKKDGRKEAADVALRTLIAEGQYSAVNPTPSVTIAPENMTHFDKIAALTHQTFNTLIATIPENLAGRKVIAGLIMKRSEDDVGIVISIGTGNRCITGDKLSLEGNTVNDSHAEIITRRGFMRFLYQQLADYKPGASHDLFVAGRSGKLQVKKGITFHLYISTAPCGDGALFSPRDVESNSGVLADVNRRDHQPTFASNVQGLLRTKMEGGEGTIPVDTKEITIQTWDGVVRGERLRTMSCTDKICRWNVLGLQGALLSHFLEPIYLDSLTLGFLYDHGHLSRAVCCRLTRDEPPLDGKLPPGFRLNHPWLGRVTACQPLRETQKTKAFSINWTIGDNKPEVLDGTLGHCYTAVEKRLFSRLAKRCLYDSFKQVAQTLGRSDLLQSPSYYQTKMAAREFQGAKVAMMNKFQQMGCGWVKKPVEEEMFS